MAQEAFGEPHAADVEGHGAHGAVVADGQLGRAAPDVDDDVVPSHRGQSRGRAPAGQRTLGLSVEQLRRHPDDVGGVAEEAVAVPGIADGRGGDEPRRGDAGLVHGAPVLRQHRHRALERLRREEVRRVDSLPEPGDAHEAAVGGAVALGDQQARRVGPTVEGGHPARAACRGQRGARHSPGIYRRTPLAAGALAQPSTDLPRCAGADSRAPPHGTRAFQSVP